MGTPCVPFLFMESAPDITERQGRLLAELAALGMDLARDLAARAKAADTDEDAAALAHAFDRVSRSVRMCLALEQRLDHERRRAEVEARDAVRDGLEHRGKQLRAAVSRAIETETEGAEKFRLLLRLSERLEEERLFETFAEGPIEAHIARIRRDLGLPPEDPANDAEPDDAPPAPAVEAWPTGPPAFAC